MERKPERISLVILARVPLPGTAKTRIAASAGPGTADRIYRDLLTETARIAGETAYHVAYTGHEHPLELSNIFSNALSFFPQTGDTLGDRMRNACTYRYSRDETGVILIGCDCPYLTGAVISQARDGLERICDVVIGPASDGGYYLIGCRQSALSIFNARGWGTPELLKETLAIINREKYRCMLLPTFSDIDEIEDFIEWKSRGQSRR